MVRLEELDFSAFLSRNNLAPDRVLIITGARYSRQVSNALSRRVTDLPAEVVSHAINSQRFHRLLCDRGASESGTTLIVGVGGGGVLDMAKYYASQTRQPYLAVPTVISNDGIASPIAIIRNDDGLMESHSTTPPIGTLIDAEVLAAAPPWSLANGLGDVLSNHSAVMDWDLAVERGHAKPNALARIMSRSAVQSVLVSTPSLRDASFLEHYIDAIVLSGLAMYISGDSRPCSGAEHLIAHVITRDHPFRFGHGFLVGSIAPFIVWLHQPTDRTLIRVAKTVGLQLDFARLLHRDQTFSGVMDSARTIRGPRFTILDELSNANLQAGYRTYVRSLSRKVETPELARAASSAQ